MTFPRHLPETTARLRSFVAAITLLILTLPGTFLLAQETEELPEMTPEELYEAHSAYLKKLRAASGSAEVGESPMGRHAWFMFQRSYPLPFIPAGIRQEAIRQSQRVEGQLAAAAARLSGKGVAAAADRPKWENIGPANIAGRVRAVIVHPSAPNTIFIGAATGGVWKYEGNPDVWVSNFDTNSALSIGSLAFDPSNPDIIYAGTGEVINSHTSQFNATPSYFGDGIFKSTDGGVTWRNIGLRSLGTISDLYVMKNDPQVVLASSAQGGGGLYRSTNGGETWAQSSGGDYPGGVTYNIEVDQSNEDNVLISTSNRIYYSENAGNTFTRSNGFSPSNATRTEIAIAPSDPSRVYALVARRGTDADIGEAYVSNDGGKNFALVYTFPSTFFNEQGHYNNCVEVHPTIKDIALFGGIDIYRTVNGGGNFSNTTLSYQGGNVHPDQHTLGFDPSNPNRVYLGNDGGVYVSNDAGNNWVRISEALPISQFYEIGIDQSRDFRVYGGTQDNGSLGTFGTLSWSSDWFRVLGGDGFHTVVDPSNPNIVYAESQYGRASRIDLSDPSDPRARYITFTMDNSQSSNYDPGPWSTPLAISELNGALYTGRLYLWQSFNRGNNWDRLDPGNSSRMSAVATGAVNEGDLMIGSATGELYFSTNGGADWARGDDSNNVPNRYISEILYDPVDGNRVYVVASGSGGGGHVFRSDNRGRTFKNVSLTLPDIPTSGFAIDPENTNILFAGNDIGVYVSLNGGELWLPFNNGFPYVPVTDLEIHREKRTLIAGTHGRSMFEISIDNPQPSPVVLAPFGGRVFGSGDTINIEWAGFNETVRVIYSLDGGATWDTLGEYTNASKARLIAPFIESNNGIVRVETLDGSIVAKSDPFSIQLKVNTDGRGSRGFIAGALEIRGDKLWAADRNLPRFVQLSLPSLPPSANSVTHSFEAGRILDLAYNPTSDNFYVLLGDTIDFSGAELWTMSVDGTTGAQIPLPVTTIAGVTHSSEGVVVITPGNDAVVYVLNPANGDVIRQTSQLDATGGIRRVGLAGDGAEYSQIVEDFQPNSTVPDAIQRISIGGGDARITQSVPLVVENGEIIDVYGLSYFQREETGEGVYYMTSTLGKFYIVTVNLVSSVTTYREVFSSVSVARISPNPSKGLSILSYTTDAAGLLEVVLFDNEGSQVLPTIRHQAVSGEGEIRLELGALPSGLYRAVLTAENGDRAAATVMVLK